MIKFGPQISSTLLSGVTAAAVALGGCASIPPPETQVARSSAAIDQALQAGAREYAPIELQSAEQKLLQARAAMADGENAAARRLAEQAQVEAELAQAKSQSATAQLAVQQVRESIRVLRDEIGDDSIEAIPLPDDGLLDPPAAPQE